MLAVAEIGATGFLTPGGSQRPLLFVACRQNKKCPQEIFAGVWATALYRRAMVQVRQKLHNHAKTIIRTFTNTFTVTSYFGCRATPSTMNRAARTAYRVFIDDTVLQLTVTFCLDSV